MSPLSESNTARFSCRNKIGHVSFVYHQMKQLARTELVVPKPHTFK